MLYYKVVAFGAPDSAVALTPAGAWASWYRAIRCADESEQGSRRAQHNARIISATTRRAALAADISEAGGTVGRGRWALGMRVQP